MFIIITQNGHESPPLTVTEIRMMIKDGSVLPGVLARRQSEAEWKKLYSYAEFFAVVPNHAKPPPGSYSTSPFASRHPVLVTPESNTFVCVDDSGYLAGPYHVGELKQMLQNGVVSHHTRVAREGKSTWCELGSLPEFFGITLPHSRPPITSYSPAVSIAG